MPAFWASVIAWLVWPIVSIWLRIRQARGARHSIPLTEAITPAQMLALKPCFPSEVLATVRVQLVPMLAAAIPPRLVRRLKLPRTLDLTTMRGMCYGDLLIIAGAPKAPPAALVFHELVHTCQYRVLGRGRFLRRYVFSYVRTLDYWQIDLELQAYELQRRFMLSQAAPDDQPPEPPPDVWYEVSAMVGRVR